MSYLDKSTILTSLKLGCDVKLNKTQAKELADIIERLERENQALSAHVARFMDIHPYDRNLRDELLLVKKDTPQTSLAEVRAKAVEEAAEYIGGCEQDYKDYAQQIRNGGE